jgi:anaphase-promoting complex subunit 1
MNKLVEIGSLTVDHVSKESSAPHEVFFPSLFDSLHFLYEESKLSLSSSAGTEMVELQQHLAGLLVKICQTVQAAYPEQGAKAELFLEYYRQDLGDEVLQGEGIGADMQMPRPGNSFSFFTTPPSIFSWMDSAIKGMSNANSGKIFYDSAEDAVSVNAACSTTRSVCRILAALLLSSSEETSKRDVNVVLTLMAEGFTEPSSILEDLPPGVSLPILEVLCRCRNNPALEEFPGWSASAWMLVGREDLSRNMSEALAGDLFAQAKLRKIPTDPGRGSSAVSEASNGVIKDEDGMVSLEESSAMLFPEDNRVHEAARLLRSSRPIFLRVARAVEVSDHDYERLKQKRLLQLSYRALALQIGRGMLTIGGLRPISAEPLPIPDLCLQGRVPPTNATLNLDVSACPADLRVWPEFHNGVAAGLRLPCDGEHMGFKITRTWILYNRPPDSRQNQSEESGEDANIALQSKSHSHGGLLLALGLRGHLTALEFSDLYQYLTQGTITTTVGVLLGMAANRRASCDISVSKMLCLHIPSLIPQHFNAIDVASTVQTAAVTGCGLLFQGSSHRMMTEFLLNEIGKRPDSDLSSFDRESYTLACGLALGMVNLCLGDNTGEMDRTAGIADLRVEERLHRYIVGGIDPEESRRMKESNDRFSLPSLSSGNDTEKCSTIFEGEMINTDITAPASILALGLMYMKTENQTVASALALPDTHFLLEFVRPDFLGLRVISRALILWNKVEPTDEWIENQVPEVIRAAYQEMRTIAEKTFGGRSPAKKPRDGFEYDRRAVRQVYLHIVSGACFGIGLRYAGTGDERAKKALYQRVMQLHALRESNDPVAAASKPEKTILDTCLGCTAISLAMVMVGTGDLDTLRLFKILRWRCDKTSQFGMHMVYGMAIGLLFLGGGTCTLGRAPQDLAALVAAFFPRFPMTGTSDDQYHLQATRHLYALAVHRRDLRALDIDTGESVHVDVKIEAEDDMQEPQHFTVPCLLRNSDFVAKRLRVASEKYFPVTVDLSQRSTSYIFYVKKRTAVLGRTTDPFLPSQPFGKPIALQQTIADLVRSLTDNPFLVAFAENLCAQNKNILSNPSFDSRAVLASLTEDHEDALPIYLALRHAFGCFRSGSDLAAGFVWNLRLLRSYYQECKRIVGSDTRPLLDTQLMLPYLHESTDQSLASRALAEKDTERFALILYG